MNYYIIVEGKKSEVILYPEWIKYVNPSLSQVHSLSHITNNNYLLISGNGHPNYYKVLENAIIDCTSYNNIDYLVIAVDSDDFSYLNKKNEILNKINGRYPLSKIKIIIQHTCLETWALGNQTICARNPRDKQLIKYLSVFDVRCNDPENLPPLPQESMTRSQFAFSYFRKILNDRYRRLTYSKNNPDILLERNYFIKIKNRFQNTGHVKSFEDFLNAFI